MQYLFSSARPSPDAPIHSTPKQPLGPGTGTDKPFVEDRICPRRANALVIGNVVPEERLNDGPGSAEQPGIAFGSSLIQILVEILLCRHLSIRRSTYRAGSPECANRKRHEAGQRRRPRSSLSHLGRAARSVVGELRMRSTSAGSLYIFPYFHELTSPPIILTSACGQ